MGGMRGICRGRRTRRMAGGGNGGAQPCEQHLACRVVIAARHLDQGAHMVGGAEHGGHQVMGRRHKALAHLVEGRLAMMGKGCQRLEAEHGA